MLSQQIDIDSWWYYDQPHLKDGDELELVPEPENEFDEDAIAIYKNEMQVGYVPKEFTWMVHKELDSGATVYATVMWPYQEETNTPPRVQLMDSETRDRYLAESAENAKKGERDAMVFAVVALVIICTPIGILLGLLL